jgi:outer membrane receptor for ferrienterochelin and colicins
MVMLFLALMSHVALAQEVPDGSAAPGEPVDFEDDDDVIVVSATRAPAALGEAPIAVEVISREEIEATGAESLAEVLEEQPGLIIEDTVVGQAIRMQGMDPEHTLILIDGQRVLGRKDGVIDLSRFPMDDIERIEIVKGPSSSLYGSDAMGGTVHIITKRGVAGRDVGLHVRYGTFDRIDLTGDVKFGTETVQHKLAVGWHGSDAWDLDPSDVATTASAFQQGDASYRMTASPTDDVQLDFNASYLQRRMEGVQITQTGAVFDVRNLIEDARASVGGWWTMGPRTKLNVRLSGSVFRSQQLSDQRGASRLDDVQEDIEQLGESMIQLDQGATFLGEHFFSVGVDGLVQGITSERLGTGKGDRQRFAVFAQDTWKIDIGQSTLTLAPGFRLDVDSQFGSAPTPRIATAFATGPVTLRASFGTGFRAPNFRELFLFFENPGVGYTIAGNPDLQPERSRNVNASIEYAPTSRFSLSVQAFRNDIDNLINIGTNDQEPGASLVFAYENIARAVTQGIDAQVRWEPRPFEFELGYAFLDTRDKELDLELPGRVPHRLTGVAAIDLPENISVRSQFGYSARRTFYQDLDGDGLATDPIKVPDRCGDGTATNFCDAGQLTVDARAVWKGDPIEVFAGIDNLLNAGQQTLAPTMPRFVYAGLNIRGKKEPK